MTCRKMEKKDRQPKPVLELELPPVLLTEMAARTRDINVPIETRFSSVSQFLGPLNLCKVR